MRQPGAATQGHTVSLPPTAGPNTACPWSIFPCTLSCRQVPVVEGAHKSLRGAAKERIADFVHGSDGFGNTTPQLAEVGGAACVSCGLWDAALRVAGGCT